ncbi:TrlF family AAA-like ATPase [Thalassospira tepidiphila]|uniref:TrlF family AAA-like ATPase n=1 Tax=Thalassospira tepidiphila TaxID=393657 RepID=UPI00292300C2|nr:hypothetical protein MACH01_21540 [Thalassospira tepidiphila]
MDEEYTKAKFWKCALQVNPASYIKYRGEIQALTEQEYNTKLLNVCLEEQIKVVGVADHGNVDGVDEIRKLLGEHDIVVFPGFEISSSEKVHFVCLFSESTSSQTLERFLGNLELLDPQDGIRPSKLSATQLVEKVQQLGGFIYAAHCTNANGVLQKRLDHIWKLDGLRACQIPGTVENLKGVEDDFYRRVLKNKEPSYYRERSMAIINAKDVEDPDTLRDATSSCRIKMTRPCFASFKQAFLDPSSRVRLNSEIPDNYASAIESVRFIGGYLDGVDINFSDHLNAVIGGRGTGKSTLLECIRFAMDITPKTDSAKKQHSEIIKENLGTEKASVILEVRSATMHGRTFTISRRFGDKPVVRDNNGNTTPYSPRDLLPHIEIFGQNEIYEISQSSVGALPLLNRFIEEGENETSVKVQNIMTQLQENRIQIVSYRQQLAEIELEVEELPKLIDEQKQFQSLGIEENLRVIPLLEAEKKLSQRSDEGIQLLNQSYASFSTSLPDTDFFKVEEAKNLPHDSILKKMEDTLNSLTKNLAKNITEISNLISTSEQKLKTHKDELASNIEKMEREIEDKFKDIPASHGKSGKEIGTRYQNIIVKIEKIKPKKRQLDKIKKEIENLTINRLALLADINEARSERSQPLVKAIKRLNKNLSGKLRLKLEVEANRTPLLDFVTNCNLENIGAKRLAWLKGENTFSPASLAQAIRKGKEAILKEKWGATSTSCDALTKLHEEKLLEMEEIELLDTIQLELNVSHNEAKESYRPLAKLSTGQQCTALLHLLLLENNDPLVLDQPEDNLDNAFIADRIVAELRSAKLSRQFIFATHNANIPVFGDAEWIGVFDVIDGKGYILPEQQGAIDQPNIQSLAANILEGGKSAFNQRREKYGFA